MWSQEWNRGAIELPTELPPGCPWALSCHDWPRTPVGRALPAALTGLAKGRQGGLCGVGEGGLGLGPGASTY